MGATRGFTLIEAIVACGVILVLAALTYPLIGAALMAGKESSSKSNLRQIYLGLMLYQEQYERKVEYGLAQDMGLPVLLPERNVALSVVPDVAVWRSKCCCHPDAPSGYPDYKGYFIDYAEYLHQEDLWKMYVEKYQGQSMLVMDYHCNSRDADLKVVGRQGVRGLGVRLDGKIEARTRRRPINDPEMFWNL